MMTKKERVEDLGIITEKLRIILDRDVFYHFKGRPKDAYIEFFNMSEDKQCDMLVELAYDLSDLESALYEVLEVARGDYDNI